MRDFTKVPLLITFGVPIIFYHKRNNGSHDLWKQQFRSQASFFLGHEHFLKETTVQTQLLLLLQQPLEIFFSSLKTRKRRILLGIGFHLIESELRKMCVCVPSLYLFYYNMIFSISK